jgi:hypothetical protein
MNNNRTQPGERRQYRSMPRVPFKDCNRTTIRKNRRKVPDRRQDNINVDWTEICSM